MLTVSSCSISCWVVICDVRAFLVLVYLSDTSPVHLERLGRIPQDIVRFWTAELSSAIAYLHKQRIVHRYVSFLHISCV